MTKEDLNKYTKDELIEAIMQFSYYYKQFGTKIYNCLVENRKRRNLKYFKELTKKSNQARKDYVKANGKYNDYLFEIARKYNIVKEDGTFKWGDWFGNVSEEENSKALSLENDVNDKLKEMNRLHKEWEKADKELI